MRTYGHSYFQDNLAAKCGTFYKAHVLVTARKRSLRRLCFYTCLSVHRGGVPGTPPGQVHPLGQVPLPRAGTPSLGRYTPLGRYPPGQVHPPGRYTPPRAVHAGRNGQQAGGTHPTGMHSCLTINLSIFQPFRSINGNFHQKTYYYRI